MTLTLNLAPDLQQRIIYEASKAGLSADGYITNVLTAHLGAPSTAPSSVDAREADLLKKLNLGFTEVEWATYHTLIEKRQNGLIKAEELTLLIDLSDRLEGANVSRMVALTELAQLREIPIDKLMQQLEIEPRAHA